MKRRTLHLVYAVPYQPTIAQWAVHRARRYLRRAISEAYQPWRSGTLYYPGTLPPSAPISITIYLLRHLHQNYNVRLYDWQETRGSFDYEPDDIILGHLAPQPGTAMQRFVECRKPSAAKILLQPYATGILDDVSFILSALPHVDAFAAICGKYWFDVIDTTPFARFKHKMHRIDMAVDVRYYPRLKTAFSPPGSRKFIFIGHNSKPSKGCAYLSHLASLLPGTHFAWIGEGPEIEGLIQLSRYKPLTPTFMRSICEQYDFFITMGVSDANPTTILESMAWGLPVICTPQSGYYETESLFTAYLEDMRANVHLIEQLQSMSDDDLLQISCTNRNVVAGDYTWEHFCRSIDNVIAQAISSAHT